MPSRFVDLHRTATFSPKGRCGGSVPSAGRGVDSGGSGANQRPQKAVSFASVLHDRPGKSSPRLRSGSSRSPSRRPTNSTSSEEVTERTGRIGWMQQEQPGCCANHWAHCCFSPYTTDPLKIPPRIGVERIESLGESAESLTLISAIVLSISIDCILQSADADLSAATEEEWWKYQKNTSAAQLICLLLACSASAYATVFGLLFGHYSRLVKSKDQSICEQVHLPAETASRMRLALSMEVDLFTLRLHNMRNGSRNSIWASLLLLLIAAGLKVIKQVQVEDEDRAVAAVCAGTVVSTVLAVLYIIHVFRTTPIGLIAGSGRSGYD